MIEVIALDEKQSKSMRMRRADGLALLFENNNAVLLKALGSLMESIKYTALLQIINDDTNRHQHRAKYNLADVFISEIKSEVSWALAEAKKPEDKEKKGD